MIESLIDSFAWDDLVVWASAAAAMASVIAAGVPLLKRNESRQRVEAVITRRKDLIKQQRDRLAKRGTQEQAARSIAAMFKLQKRSGQAKVRAHLAAAGLRKPSAAITYFTIRLVLPVVFGGLTLLVLSSGKYPVPLGGVICGVILAAAAGYGLPYILVKNMADRRKQEIGERFPDALDLLLVCVEGGLGLEAAIQRVGEDIGRTSPVLAEEFGLLGAELAFLGDRIQAFKNFGQRTGDAAARSFANAFLQAEKYGTSIGTALRVLAGDMRDIRMSEAEKKAASLPVKLTVPMMAFFMPPLFIIILGPAVLQALATIRNL